MNRGAAILTASLAVVILTLGTAWAQQKFPNKDTATNRQESTWGTSKAQTPTGEEVFGTDPATGDSTMKADPGPKKEPVDWYDKVIITVNPEVKYPYNKDGVSTTTTTTYNNSTDTQTTSTTTVTD